MMRRRWRIRRVVVNGAFRSQRVTGQQRYANEIADQLVAQGAREVRPGPFWSASGLRAWIWTLTILPLRTWNQTLVSLTARAPVLHPRQVLAVHDLFVLTNPEWYSRSYVRSHAPVLRAHLRGAAALFAVSAPVAEQVEAVTGRQHVAVAPNAAGRVFADTTEPVLPEQLDLTPGRFLIAIGNQEPRKNLVTLSRAWALIPETDRLATPLVVVGSGADIYAAADVRWPSGTIVAGYVTDPQLAALYSATRALVFVSLAEGFGLPIVEAAAAGVRLFVLSGIPVFRWIARDAARYVDPSSPRAIADALLTVLRADATPAQIDLERFDWGRSAATVAAIAARVASR